MCSATLILNKEYISGNVGLAFFKHQTRNVHHKPNKMTPLVLSWTLKTVSRVTIHHVVSMND